MQQVTENPITIIQTCNSFELYYCLLNLTTPPFKLTFWERLLELIL